MNLRCARLSWTVIEGLSEITFFTKSHKILLIQTSQWYLLQMQMENFLDCLCCTLWIALCFYGCLHGTLLIKAHSNGGMSNVVCGSDLGVQVMWLRCAAFCLWVHCQLDELKMEKRKEDENLLLYTQLSG